VTIIRLDKKEKVIGVDRIEGLVGEDDDDAGDEKEVYVDGVLLEGVDLNDSSDIDIEQGEE
jgi:DNA gyrase subunit A